MPTQFAWRADSEGGGCNAGESLDQARKLAAAALHARPTTFMLDPLLVAFALRAETSEEPHEQQLSQCTCLLGSAALSPTRRHVAASRRAINVQCVLHRSHCVQVWLGQHSQPLRVDLPDSILNRSAGSVHCARHAQARVANLQELADQLQRLLSQPAFRMPGVADVMVREVLNERALADELLAWWNHKPPLG